MARSERKPVIMLLAKPYSVDTRVKNEAETLTTAGHRVTVLSWDRWGREPKRASVNDVEVISPRLLGSDLFASNKGSVSSKLVYALSAVLLQFYCVVWCLRNLKERYIVHANDFNTLMAGVALRLVRPNDVKLVYDCHEFTPTVYAEWYGAMVGAAAGLFERTLVRYADAVVTVSPSFASYLGKMTKPPTPSRVVPVTVLYNTVKSSDLPSGEKADLRSHLGLSGFVFTFVGAMRGVYALDAFVESARLFKEAAVRANFVIVGGGDEFAGLELKIAKHALEGWVRLIPQLPNREALKYLKAGDVSFGVYRSPDTNARIALPWKVFEAIACGTPVMVLENTTAWNLVRENGVGFGVTSSDAPEIHEKLLWAVSHPETLAEMASRAREAYDRTFNWESASQGFRDTYSDL